MNFKEKATKKGLVTCLALFNRLIRRKEKEGKVFRKKSDEPLINVMVDGGGSCGKTSIIMRIVCDQFIDEYDPTCHDVYKRQFIIDGVSDYINFEDCYGCDDNHDYHWSYVKFDILIIVVSMSSKTSLNNMERSITKLVELKGTNAPCIVAMNKCDLHKWYEMNLEMVNEIIGKYQLANCSVIQTSAKTGENIQELAAICIRSYRSLIGDPISILKKVLKKQETKKGCIIT